MKKNFCRLFAVLAAVMLMSITVLEMNAEARAGGGRSSGYRGSRSYSRPNTSYSQPTPSRQQPFNSAPNAMQQPGGGFLRSMAGGIAGGLLGGMLFRSLGFAGGGGMGGGGIGLMEILLLAGIGYMIYRFVKKKREAGLATPYGQTGFQTGTITSIPGSFNSSFPAANPVESGITGIRSMDPSFDEQHFKDSVMDHFFRIQGAWMNRELAPVASLLTDKMKEVLQDDVNRLLRDRQVNRLENIAVRNVEVVEAWQESGQDYITTLIYANLLDYTTDDATGSVISGSRTEPVKFEEYWTFTRPVGSGQWRLSAIDQK